MKSVVMLTITFIVAVLALASLTIAGVPQMINYQGRLTDTLGAPYDGNATMMFSIWDDSTGGNQLWDETHGVVAVSDGLFNVLLGGTNPIPDSVFAQPDAWLDIIANGNQMEPRTQIVSVGYAYHALRSDTADFALSPGNGWVDDGAVVRLADSTDNVGIGTMTPGARIEVAEDLTSSTATAIRVRNTGQNQNGWAFETIHKGQTRIGIAPDWMIMFDEDSTQSVVFNSYAPQTAFFKRNVGIGTTTPDEKLTVDGNAHITGNLTVDGSIGGAGAIPSGVIVMWSGTIANVPEGWALCDGTNGTPDLTDKFIKSVPNSSTDPGQTGGSTTHNHGGQTGNHTLTIDEMPAHSHTFGMHNWDQDGFVMPDRSGASTRQASPSTDATGGNQPHNHPISSDTTLPPYYELAFIMKL